MTVQTGLASLLCLTWPKQPGYPTDNRYRQHFPQASIRSSRATTTGCNSARGEARAFLIRYPYRNLTSEQKKIECGHSYQLSGTGEAYVVRCCSNPVSTWYPTAANSSGRISDVGFPSRTW